MVSHCLEKEKQKKLMKETDEPGGTPIRQPKPTRMIWANPLPVQGETTIPKNSSVARDDVIAFEGELE